MKQRLKIKPNSEEELVMAKVIYGHLEVADAAEILGVTKSAVHHYTSRYAQTVTPLTANPEGFKCDLCIRVFKTRTALSAHIRGAHSVGILEYCKRCGAYLTEETKGLNSCYRCKNSLVNKLPDIDTTKAFQLRKKYIVFSHYGLECKCCKENTLEFLSIDHVNGDGAEHRKTVNAGALYKWLIDNNFPKEFQTLCYNCNYSKRNKLYCPHELL